MGGEKRKWFDRRSIPPAVQLVSSASVSYQDVQTFSAYVLKLREHKRISKECTVLWQCLWVMPPAARLALNLKIMLPVLAKQDITDFVQEGLTKHERDALRELAVASVESSILATAEGLLNLNERRRFIQLAKDMFREERNRRWPWPRKSRDETS